MIPVNVMGTNLAKADVMNLEYRLGTKNLAEHSRQGTLRDLVKSDLGCYSTVVRRHN